MVKGMSAGSWIAILGTILAALSLAGGIAWQVFWSRAEATAHVAAYQQKKETDDKAADRLDRRIEKMEEAVQQTSRNVFAIGSKLRVRSLEKLESEDMP